MSSPLAVDLGTTHTRISRQEHVLIQRFPSAIAINTRSGDPIAIGKDALPMLGRTPADVRACRPLQNSVVADYDLAVVMLNTFFKQAQALGFLQRPTVVVSIPHGITEVERRALEDVIRDAGARSVRLIPHAVAAAYGAGLNIASPHGSMIVDIGGGTTKAAVLCYNGVVSARTGRTAGDEFDHAIIAHLRAAYGLIIGEQSAHAIKCRIGTAHPSIDRGSLMVSGRNVQNGLAATAEISSADVAEALRKPIARIIHLMRATLEAAPPELSADIFATGPILCGESAKLPGLAKVIANGIGMRVTTATECGDCVIKGLQKAIDEKK
ncbi:MAG: rod shape-determining protein [Clostridia bacterium]|nr:rod shape-determining protein [Clostridia bacterium]